MSDKLPLEISMTGKQFEELGNLAKYEGFANQREYLVDLVRGKLKEYRDKILRRDADLIELQ